jgi:hypothetical protein
MKVLVSGDKVVSVGTQVCVAGVLTGDGAGCGASLDVAHADLFLFAGISVAFRCPECGRRSLIAGYTGPAVTRYPVPLTPGLVAADSPVVEAEPK